MATIEEARSQSKQNLVCIGLQGTTPAQPETGNWNSRCCICACAAETFTAALSVSNANQQLVAAALVAGGDSGKDRLDTLIML